MPQVLRGKDVVRIDLPLMLAALWRRRRVHAGELRRRNTDGTEFFRLGHARTMKGGRVGRDGKEGTQNEQGSQVMQLG